MQEITDITDLFLGNDALAAPNMLTFWFALAQNYHSFTRGPRGRAPALFSLYHSFICIYPCLFSITLIWLIPISTHPVFGPYMHF